jgi:hypothetical protein
VQSRWACRAFSKACLPFYSGDSRHLFPSAGERVCGIPLTTSGAGRIERGRCGRGRRAGWARSATFGAADAKARERGRAYCMPTRAIAMPGRHRYGILSKRAIPIHSTFLFGGRRTDGCRFGARFAVVALLHFCLPAGISCQTPGRDVMRIRLCSHVPLPTCSALLCAYLLVRAAGSHNYHSIDMLRWLVAL